MFLRLSSTQLFSGVGEEKMEYFEADETMKLEIEEPQLKDFPCSKCNFKGVSQRVVKVHMQREHWDLTFAFNCRRCQLSFHKRAAFEKHIKAAHLKHANFTMKGLRCKKCPDQFNSLWDLSDHVKEVHYFQYYHFFYGAQNILKSGMVKSQLALIHSPCQT